MMLPRQDVVFELIKSMSKAEKRNFKLYSTRQAGNQDAKFIQLFDAMDALDEYDEAKILKRCPVKKEQLANMKAHLYRQILVSIRMLQVQHRRIMQLREQMDFAHILYEKGLYRQSLKILDRVKDSALESEQFTVVLDVMDFQKAIELIYPQMSMEENLAILNHGKNYTAKIDSVYELAFISIQLFKLYQQLGYVRTQKDIDLIKLYFQPRLEVYRSRVDLAFNERFYLYQSLVWYNYIQHDFLQCYKFARRWISLFDNHPEMKELRYDNYIHGYARLLDGLFLLQNYRRLVDATVRLQAERERMDATNENLIVLTDTTLYFSEINRYTMDGNFAYGVGRMPVIERFVEEKKYYLDLHKQMLFYYKIACIYFGNGDYRKCIELLRRVIETRDPQIRRDLQCYARLLTLISHYELGIDHNVDYQVKSVYAFLVKMNDMHAVQHEMVSFLRRLGTIYTGDFKGELVALYHRLKPLESHPYERRTFFYLDIISWLESKIRGVTIAEVIQSKFRAQNQKNHQQKDTKS